MAAKKVPSRSEGKKHAKKPSAATKADVPKSMPKEGRDPKGGLTAKGREYFNKKEGSHLRPGVQGPANTPEKMVRKGSFLRRHFTHPRGPMKDDKGEPTRLALSAHAWGEPVPQNLAEAKRLSSKGHELLEEYHHIKEEAEVGGKSSEKAASPAAVKTAAKGSSRKSAAKRAPKAMSKKAPAKASAPKKATAKKSAAKRSAANKTAKR